MSYIAVVKVEAGKVTKMMDFDNEGAATAHVGQYGGFVAANPGGAFEFWVADAAAKTLTHNSVAENAATPIRAAQALLEKHDAKGYTRAWETSVAPLVAAGTLPEYDQTVFDAKKAARAVVVG